MKGKVVIGRNKTCFLTGLLFLALGAGWADNESPAEPAEPKPSAPVQQTLEESDRLSLANQLEKALQATEQAAALARTTLIMSGSWSTACTSANQRRIGKASWPVPQARSSNRPWPETWARRTRSVIIASGYGSRYRS